MEETTITDQTVPAPEHGLLLGPEAQYYLNEGAGWAKLLGILGFIGCGIILILAFSIGSLFSLASKFSPNPSAFAPAMGVFVGVIYGLMALLYFFPSLYLYQFAVNVKRGILFTENAHIITATIKLKSFFKFWGVLTIILLAFSVLGIFSVITTIGHLSGLR